MFLWTRRLLLVSFAATTLLPNVAEAQDKFPSRPITVVVPFPPGAMTDFVGRLVAERLTSALGTPVVVENRAGASGMIGTDQVIKAPADGYTLLIMTTDATVRMMQNREQSPLDQLSHIAMLASQPMMLVVGSKQPATLPDYVRNAKQNPGTVSFGSNGEGSATHLAMEDFAKQAGIRLNHIPYKGAVPALNDVIGGQLDSMPISFQAAGGHLAGGKIRALAISGQKRLASAPQVPTFAESGFPQFELRLWYGLSAPKGLPEPIRERLQKAVQSAFDSPEVRSRLASQAGESMAGVEAQAFMRTEVQHWRGTLK